MDIGFVQEGIIPVVAVEIDPDFSLAYEKMSREETLVPNLVESAPKSKIINDDIRAWSGRKLLSEAESRSFANPFGQPIVGVLGGPPCQDFSNGGKNRGVDGERGKLVLDFMQKIEEIRPMFFVFENVKGLYSTKKHRESAFDILVREFRKLGYVVEYRLLNALHYGVPQDRERIFIVGFRSDILKDGKRRFRWPREVYPNAKSLPWPKTNKPGIPIEVDPRLPRELMVATAFTGVEGLPNQQDQFVPKSSKFRYIEEGDDSRKSFKRLHRFRYSPAVAYGNNEVHLHPVEDRRISVREALRLQTVPDSYVLPADMTLTKKFKLVSNGVPVKLARLLASSIADFLRSLLP